MIRPVRCHTVLLEPLEEPPPAVRSWLRGSRRGRDLLLRLEITANDLLDGLKRAPK
jgi:hypothetical protein